MPIILLSRQKTRLPRSENHHCVIFRTVVETGIMAGRSIKWAIIFIVVVIAITANIKNCEAARPLSDDLQAGSLGGSISADLQGGLPGGLLDGSISDDSLGGSLRGKFLLPEQVSIGNGGSLGNLLGAKG